MQVAFLHGEPVPFFALHLKSVQGVGCNDAFDGVDQIIGARHFRIVVENHGGGEAVHAEGCYAAQFRKMGFEIILFLREIADCVADNTHAPAHLMREVAFQERTFLTFLKQHEKHLVLQFSQETFHSFRDGAFVLYIVFVHPLHEIGELLPGGVEPEQEFRLGSLCRVIVDQQVPGRRSEFRACNAGEIPDRFFEHGSILLCKVWKFPDPVNVHAEPSGKGVNHLDFLQTFEIKINQRIHFSPQRSMLWKSHQMMFSGVNCP